MSCQVRNGISKVPGLGVLDIHWAAIELSVAFVMLALGTGHYSTR